MTVDPPFLEELAKVANALFAKGEYREALEKYRTMATAGSIEAQLRVGWMYHTGRGVKVDLHEARRWYLLAAEKDSPEAQFYLGKLYRQEGLYQEAMNLFQKSAEQNYMPSIYELGVMYELGEGVPKDTNKAYMYYDQSARMGHLKAQRDIAVAMIKAQFGIRLIPKGILMLPRIIYNVLRVGLKDTEWDRIRW